MGPQHDPKLLLAMMKDRPKDYNVEPVGQIPTVHTFHHVLDMQVTTSTDPTHNKLRDTVLKRTYPDILKFELSRATAPLPGERVGPPGRFAPSGHFDLPVNYYYKQNADIEMEEGEDGRRTLKNLKQATTHFINITPISAKEVPSKLPPDAGVVPEDEIDDEDLIGYIQTLRKELETRPIMSTRVIDSKLGVSMYHHKFAWCYVGYTFRSGPWKDALIKYGLDPRKDPKYRFYQKEMWKMEGPVTSSVPPMGARYDRFGVGEWEKATPSVPHPSETYIFDGSNLHTGGSVWQFCDITDPQIKTILDTPRIRKTFHVRFLHCCCVGGCTNAPYRTDWAGTIMVQSPRSRSLFDSSSGAFCGEIKSLLAKLIGSYTFLT
jgi:general transcription factor 3C polypeptide 5 (transcription factor C subunit 1)